MAANRAPGRRPLRYVILKYLGDDEYTRNYEIVPAGQQFPSDYKKISIPLSFASAERITINFDAAPRGVNAHGH